MREAVRGYQRERLSDRTMGRDCQKVLQGDTVRGYHRGETFRGFNGERLSVPQKMTVRGYHGKRLSVSTIGRDCQRVPQGETGRGYHGKRMSESTTGIAFRG